MAYDTDDLRIAEIREVITPAALHREMPITEAAARTAWQARRAIHEILTGDDDRLMVIVGPCSIHDVDAAREYARHLEAARAELGQDLLIVMRVYFEKPRTTVGWKGLINDPNLDGSFHINMGLRTARRLLLDLNEMDVPAATEYLDLVTPQYITDLVSWGAIGARTTESQVHRELASGLSCPVGFKNGTDGSLKIAIDAMHAAGHPHHFLSMTKEGHSAIFSTAGNPDTHLILRGGKEPNYDAASVQAATEALQSAGLPARVMIDFSHANSRKQPERQVEVGREVARQLADGERRIFGVMMESHLHAGRQDLVDGQAPQYGVSITDGCLAWDDTLPLLRELARAVRERREHPGSVAAS